MTPDKWERVKEIFEGALERSPEKRLEFLAEACGGDESLLGEVQRLLAEDDRASDFLNSPVWPKGSVPALAPEFGGQSAEEAIAGSGSLHALRQRYDVLAEVGRGGMGIVYKARDRETGAVVALKVLRPEIAADTAVIERFKSELLLARKVTDKNVCRIYELLRFGEAVAISMEYIEGESLRQFLTRYNAVSIRKGAQWASQICHALSEAHGQGIVHRDLKPENIVIDRDGNVKVMDFGIARSAETPTTTAGVMVGTPAYMAPEQAEGKPTDTRSDIYSLGLVLYEMFTGQRAFRADTPVGLALKQIHDTPPAPREVEPAIPAHIEKAILKCLEKNPDKRFQSVDELEAALTKKPEAKLTAVQGEGAEVALPISLATWQRSDWFLLASGILGAVVFFLLFYRLHPASALVIDRNAEQARQNTAEALKKLQWDVKVERPELDFFNAFDSYYALSSTAGSWAAKYGLLRIEGLAGWRGRLRRSEPEGKGLESDYEYTTNSHGRLQALYLIHNWPVTAFPFSKGSAPGEAITAKMRETAQTVAETLFGQDLSATKATASAQWNPVNQRWGVEFSWTLPQQSQGVDTKIWVSVDGARLVFIRRDPYAVTSVNQLYAWKAYVPPWSYFLNGLIMVVFVFVLFFARRVYREPRSPQNLRLAILGGITGAVAISPSLPEFGVPGERWLGTLVWAVMVFSILTVLSYAVLNTVLYYLSRCFPVQAANYLQCLRGHGFARTAGLEMLRGVIAGAAFGGIWMGLFSLATVWGKAAVGMIFWRSFYSAWWFRGVPLGPFQAGIFPVLQMGEVLSTAWLLVALPLSLLSRATTRWRVLLAALSTLWMALGFSLAGAMVFPTLPYYTFVVLQAVFCSVVRSFSVSDSWPRSQPSSQLKLASLLFPS